MVVAGDLPQRPEVQDFRRTVAPAHGDDVDAQRTRARAQLGGESSQGAGQTVETLCVDEAFRRRVVGPRLDLDGDPMALSAQQKVDLGMPGAQVTGDDAVARGRQRFCGELFAIGATALRRSGPCPRHAVPARSRSVRT